MTTPETLASAASASRGKTGHLAFEFCGKRLPLQVMHSAAGHYLGTSREEGPCSRESAEYWPSRADAQAALDNGTWTQKPYP